MAVDHPLENIAKVCVGLNVIELRGFDKGADCRPAFAAAVAAGEQMILAAKSNRTNGTLDRIGIELDPAVIEEAAEAIPATKGVADRLSQTASRRKLRQLALEPTPK